MVFLASTLGLISLFLVVAAICVHRVSLLSLLLFMEAGVLFLCLVCGVFIKGGAMFCILVIMAFSAVEAAVGLVLLALLGRCYGGDMLKLLSASKS